MRVETADTNETSPQHSIPALQIFTPVYFWLSMHMFLKHKYDAQAEKYYRWPLGILSSSTLIFTSALQNSTLWKPALQIRFNWLLSELNVLPRLEEGRFCPLAGSGYVGLWDFEDVRLLDALRCRTRGATNHTSKVAERKSNVWIIHRRSRERSRPAYFWVPGVATVWRLPSLIHGGCLLLPDVAWSWSEWSERVTCQLGTRGDKFSRGVCGCWLSGCFTLSL